MSLLPTTNPYYITKRGLTILNVSQILLRVMFVEHLSSMIMVSVCISDPTPTASIDDLQLRKPVLLCVTLMVHFPTISISMNPLMNPLKIKAFLISIVNQTMESNALTRTRRTNQTTLPFLHQMIMTFFYLIKILHHTTTPHIFLNLI